MARHYYPYYQLLGWLLIATAILSTQYTQQMLNVFEVIFATVLIGSTAFGSHLMRLGFHRWLSNASLGQQLFYFTLTSIVTAACAGLALIISIWVMAHQGWIDPIAPGRFSVLFHMVYWANCFNMLLALLLWSAIYLTLSKARQLHDTREELARSQLDALIQQLNPHFLFNALNNIRALILENPANARDALSRLADMLRYTLSTNVGNKVTLVEELAIVDEYIALQQIQFEQRLKFTRHVSTECKKALIPRMILQLCIENAVKHGIAPQREGGQISLQVQQQNKYLLIQIQNPGQLQQSKTNSRQGIGIHNIERRLALLYSQHSAVKFQIGNDTTATGEPCVITCIQLPLEYDLSFDGA